MNALISVSDKTGVAEFAAALVGLGFNLLSTGGTAKLLQEAGLPVTEVASVIDRSVHATEALLVRARRAFRRAYEEVGA